MFYQIEKKYAFQKLCPPNPIFFVLRSAVVCIIIAAHIKKIISFNLICVQKFLCPFANKIIYIFMSQKSFHLSLKK